MKPEIKAMLPELPFPCGYDQLFYRVEDVKAWLDKLTEGAIEHYGELGYLCTLSLERQKTSTHRFLLINLGEIKKQTPLEILTDAVNRARLVYATNDCPAAFMDEILTEALAQIEAAT